MIKYGFSVLAGLLMLAGCASAKMDRVEANESAIEFSKRMKVSFANKLDKLIEQATVGNEEDRGDHYYYDYSFFPIEAGEQGVKAAFEQLCGKKGGVPGGEWQFGGMHCLTAMGMSLFAVDVYGRAVRGVNFPKVTVAVWEPKTMPSQTIEAMKTQIDKRQDEASRRSRQEVQERNRKRAALQESARAKGLDLTRLHEYCVQYGVVARPASNLERAAGSTGYQIDRANAYKLCMMQQGFTGSEADQSRQMLR